MEKIFKVWMKSWLWYSSPLKFAGVGKVFVKVSPLHFLEKRKCALKLNFWAESIVGSSNNMEKIFKVRMKFWLWYSGPLKFAGVGKVFVKVLPLHFLENRKCA